MGIEAYFSRTGYTGVRDAAAKVMAAVALLLNRPLILLPLFHITVEMQQASETVFPEPQCRPFCANSGCTVDDDIFAGGVPELGNPRRQMRVREVDRTGNVAGRKFLGCAHIKNDQR